MAILPALLGQVHGDVAGTFSNAEVHAIDQRDGDGPYDLEQWVPFAGLALEGNRCFGDDMAINDEIMGSGAAHAKGFPGGINAHLG